MLIYIYIYVRVCIYIYACIYYIYTHTNGYVISMCITYALDKATDGLVQELCSCVQTCMHT